MILPHRLGKLWPIMAKIADPKALAAALLFVLLGLGALAAQEPTDVPESATPTLKRTEAVSHEERLVDLAGVLGGLHHLVPVCDPAAGELWRNRMMELIRLERPATTQQNRMVAAFNAGFGAAQSAFSSCTDDARLRARRLAQEGEHIARSLGGRL